MTPLKVIDLFAGPGGLGEGFASYRTPEGHQAFKIALSIEKEASAHRTLLLRSLFRQYPDGDAPEAYYDFLRGDLGATPEEELYQLPELQGKLELARQEVQAIELGVTDKKEVNRRVRDALSGDDFVLIGGPPCQAYSLAGRVRHMRERPIPYNPDEDHRNFLYREYLEIIAKFQPAVFVMENVKGLLSARTSEGLVFPRIRSDLADPCKSTNLKPDRGRKRSKYKIFSFVCGKQGDSAQQSTANRRDARDFVIRVEEFGIPQARHRVILLGVRDFTGPPPRTLEPNETRVTVKDAISALPPLRSGISKGSDSAEKWEQVPDSTRRKLEKLSSPFPPSVASSIFDASRKVKSWASRGSEFGMTTSYEGMPADLVSWFRDPRMGGGITNHTSRSHIIDDLSRYWFAAHYRQTASRSPRTKDFPEPLWPAHKNFLTGKFADRFRVQGWDQPASTITSHIAKDGHYFIHPDPSQMRSLTVREAARLQTFPDNYHFVGNRTSQYVQVGNAVPPLLAKQLAEIVYEKLL